MSFNAWQKIWVLHSLVALAFCSALLSSAAAFAETFSFAWPLPSHGQLVTGATKKGLDSQATYRFALEGGDTDGLKLSFSDFRFVELNGKKLAGNDAASQLGPLAALMSELPQMHISRQGAYLGIEGLDTMREKLLASLPSDGNEDVEARLTHMLNSPETQDLLRARSGDMWNLWVGAWNGITLSEGERITGSEPVELMGQQLEQTIVVEHLGEDRDYPGRARLRMTSVLEGPEVAKLIGRMARQLTDQSAPAQWASASSINVSEIVTNPDTLRPDYASNKKVVVLRDAEGQEHRQSETREFAFKWD